MEKWNQGNRFLRFLYQHLYLRFKGTDPDRLFMLQWITFIDRTTIGTSINDKTTNQIPSRFILEQNYPNPFNPETIIKYYVPYNSNISIKIYNILGVEVATLFKGNTPAGEYSIKFNGSNLASGIYLCRMETNNFSDTKKLILLK